jgi:ribosomal protein S27E
MGFEMEDFDFKLTCAHCGHNISVPLIYAGKRIKCPKCNDILVVPKAGSAAPSANQGGLKDSKSGTKYAGFDHALFDIPPEDSTTNQLSGQGALSEKDLEELQKPVEKETSEEAEPFGIRRLPWIIDIFLYPLSFWGLVNLTIIIGVPLLLDFLQKIMIIQLSCLFWLIALVIKVIVFLFMYWYFAESVRDSAEGGLRVPNVRGSVPGAVDMFLQMVNIIGCLGIFFLPLLI